MNRKHYFIHIRTPKRFSIFFFSFHFVSPCQQLPTIWKREKKTFDNIILYLFRFISIHSIVVNFLCHSKNMSIQQFCTIQVHNLSLSIFVQMYGTDYGFIVSLKKKNPSFLYTFNKNIESKEIRKSKIKPLNLDSSMREKREVYLKVFFSLSSFYFIFIFLLRILNDIGYCSLCHIYCMRLCVIFLIFVVFVFITTTH